MRYSQEVLYKKSSTDEDERFRGSKLKDSETTQEEWEEKLGLSLERKGESFPRQWKK